MNISTRPFRFGVVATPQAGGKEWRHTARRVADLGYSTLLMPDGLQLLSPFPSLAMAACVPDLRVGTFVAAGPMRTPRSAAWEAHSLTVLTDGRFEFGIGTGRPAVREFVRQLGLPYRSGAERLADVAATIGHLRELDGAAHTPVLVAAGGPRSRAFAAAKADIVTLATAPLTSRADVAAMAAEVREHAGEREIEVAMNLFLVGDEAPPWTERMIGVDVDTLLAGDSLTVLRGTTAEMADELCRRRDAFGVSYICVNAAFTEQLAPVVARLAGR